MAFWSDFGPVAFEECHHRFMRAESGRILDAVEQFSTQDDPLVRFMLAVRDLPGIFLHGHEAHRFSMNSFIPLGRQGDLGIAYGLMGAFWRPDYGLLVNATEKQFWQMDDTSVCRLLLTFEAIECGPDLCRLVTRTRISCPALMHRRMSCYWAAIRPISGMLRHRVLRNIEKKLENNK